MQLKEDLHGAWPVQRKARGQCRDLKVIDEQLANGVRQGYLTAGAANPHPNKHSQRPGREEEASDEEKAIARLGGALSAFAMTSALESLTACRAEAATMTALANLTMAPFLVASFLALRIANGVSIFECRVSCAIAEACGGEDALRHINCV